MSGLTGAASEQRGTLVPRRSNLPEGVTTRRGKIDTSGVRILGAPVVPSISIDAIPPRSITSTRAPRFLLYSALVMSIFQLYVIPLGGFHLSIGLISAYALIFLAKPSQAIAQPIAIALGALYVLEAISLSWSPSLLVGAHEIVFTLPFLITFLAARQIAMKDETAIVGALKVFCLVACLHSALIIAMTVFPALKEALPDSPVAGLFMNENSVEALNSGALLDNAGGAGKAGGFFDNANVAGVWSATVLAATISVIYYGKSLIYIPVALLHLAAIVACGSKASLILLALIPVIVVLIFMVFPPTGRRPQVFLAGALTTLIAGLSLVIRDALSQSQFMSSSQSTLSTRMVMWRHAWREFQITPWLGQGFGGWTLSFAPVGEAYRYLGINPSFPPHNSLIILWSQSGLGALLLGLVIIFLLIKTAMAPRHGKNGLRLAQCALGAYLFVIIQAMGENYGILGEVHIQIPLAVLLGWASIYQPSARAKA